MDNSAKNTPFPVDQLEELYFPKKKEANQANSEIDGNVAHDSEEKPLNEAPSTDAETNTEDVKNFDQDLTQFLASKKETPGRDEKVERAASLGLA